MQVLSQVLLWSALAASTANAEPLARADGPRRVELQEGDPAPKFACRDDSGRIWQSTDHVGQKVVVVYFYPADFTSGCSQQAQRFRDNMNRLTDMGVEVVGISGDSASNHALFKQHFQLNFSLLADEEGALAELFGVPFRQSGRRVVARARDRQPIQDNNGEPVVLNRKVTISRWTFIIGKDNTLVYKNTMVRPRQDSEQVVKFIEDMQSQ